MNVHHSRAVAANDDVRRAAGGELVVAVAIEGKHAFTPKQHRRVERNALGTGNRDRAEQAWRKRRHDLLPWRADAQQQAVLVSRFNDIEIAAYRRRADGSFGCARVSRIWRILSASKGRMLPMKSSAR